VPGCWSQGRTEKEALDNIRVAIKEYLLARQALLKKKDVRVVVPKERIQIYVESRTNA
jgi:predicted RNase H-like HicB family nuclease